MLDTCVEEGHGQTVYVRGEPGIGKTRLLEEFARVAAEKGISAHRGLVLPFGVGKGQDAIRSLVRSLLGIPPESGKAVRQQAAATAISNGWLDADQAVFLNDLLDLPQPTEQRALYDAMDNATRNEGKHGAASKLLGVTSNTRPILAIIEDVHWADAITLAHLSSFAKTVAECPALLVMTSRIEGDQIDRQWLSGTDGCPFVTIELGPLRKLESLALIGKFVDANDALADSYLERAAGNPLFLEELLRNANEDTTKSLPDSIQSLVLARLDRLAPEDKRALQAASVLGQRFETGLLRHLIENEDYDCRGLVEHNLARPDGAAYLFAHALIQEGVYSSLLKRRRRHLHEKAAEWFAGDDLVLHAQHLDQADDERAPVAYLAAAREQAQQYRIERALSLVESGLHLASRHSDRHRLNCLKGELLHDLGNIEASMGVYRESLESAEDDEQRCDAWMGLAAGLRVSTEYESALEMLDKVEPIARQRNFTPQLARLHHLRGNLYFQLGNDECHREHATALGLAQRAGLVEEEARALGGLGDAAYAAGLMITAHDNFRRCIELCNEHGFGRIEAAYLGMTTFSQMYFCSLEDAKLSALTAIDAALRVGHQRAEMNSRLGMCDILLLTGEHDLVQEHAERGLALARALGARAWEAPMLLYRGIALHGTCPSDAIELVTRAVSMSRDIGKAFNGGGRSVHWRGWPIPEPCGRARWRKASPC